MTLHSCRILVAAAALAAFTCSSHAVSAKLKRDVERFRKLIADAGIPRL